MNIDELRAQWSEVLNHLERSNRMAWIAYFDARLAKIEGSSLSLDFSDVRKFSGALEFPEVRAVHRKALEESIFEITGATFQVKEST